MTPTITGVQLGGGPDMPLLVLGPSLGTSATALWSAAGARLADSFHLVAWDLPGHGRNRSVPADVTFDVAFDVAGLAQGVLELVDRIGGTSFSYAGDSIGGAVGLQLLLDAPDRVRNAVLLCTGARIGEPSGWHERAELVRKAGTPAVVEASAQRWFAPGFLEREPEVATTLLHALQDTDRFGYAAACEALAAFDVRDRLAQIATPVLAVAGSHDQPTPVDGLRQIADGVKDGRLVVLDEVAHLAPAEAPAEVAQLVREHCLGHAGMRVRREVLGDAHVDRAVAGTTAFTREFQELITDYAWGRIWTRPGLDRRSRSMITLTALIARGHHEELAMHVRAARRNGLTTEEIKEVLLQAAIYCGVPDANTAFRIAQPILAETDADIDAGEQP